MNKFIAVLLGFCLCITIFCVAMIILISGFALGQPDQNYTALRANYTQLLDENSELRMQNDMALNVIASFQNTSYSLQSTLSTTRWILLNDKNCSDAVRQSLVQLEGK